MKKEIVYAKQDFYAPILITDEIKRYNVGDKFYLYRNVGFFNMNGSLDTENTHAVVDDKKNSFRVGDIQVKNNFETLKEQRKRKLLKLSKVK